MDQLFFDFALALGLGLLVGFQRERATKDLAGIRTFGLIALLGAVAAALAQTLGAWVLGVFLGGLAATLWGAQRASPEPPGGVTTEIAALLMFGIGALVVAGDQALAVVTTGATAVLLHWKRPLHDWVRRLGDDEIRAVMRFVLIGLVILPVLPDKTFGPFDVLNPFRIWLMVVLIVGISVCAYVAHRVAGSRVGTLLAGILGGLISSTATAVSYARQSRDNAQEVPVAAVVLIVSSTVVFLRMIGEIAIVAPQLLRALAPPLLAMMGLMAAVSSLAMYRARGLATREQADHVPSTLGTAIGFGLLYAAVLFGIAAAKRYFGETGLYTVAVFSGLGDVDAITLSTTQLAGAGRISPELGWRLILTGAMANLAFKGIAAASLGDPRLRVWVLTTFGGSIAGGMLILWLWPSSP